MQHVQAHELRTLVVKNHAQVVEGEEAVKAFRQGVEQLRQVTMGGDCAGNFSQRQVLAQGCFSLTYHMVNSAVAHVEAPGFRHQACYATAHPPRRASGINTCHLSGPGRCNWTTRTGYRYYQSRGGLVSVICQPTKDGRGRSGVNDTLAVEAPPKPVREYTVQYSGLAVQQRGPEPRGLPHGTLRNPGGHSRLSTTNPAPGGPGIEPRWTRGAKEAVGTAYAVSSRVWYTVANGVLTEVYYPTIDSPQVRDLQYLVTDGETFFHDERRHTITTLQSLDGPALGLKITNCDCEGRYRLEKTI